MENNGEISPAEKLAALDIDPVGKNPPPFKQIDIDPKHILDELINGRSKTTTPCALDTDIATATKTIRENIWSEEDFIHRMANEGERAQSEKSDLHTSSAKTDA